VMALAVAAGFWWEHPPLPPSPGDAGPLAPTWRWVAAALLYASYNVLLALPVLAPLGAVADATARRRGGAAGGLALGLLAAVIHATIRAYPPAQSAEVPMLAVANVLAPWASALYGAAMLAEIFTTAVPSLYGLASRLSGDGRVPYRTAVLAVAGLAVLAAQFGFARLVRYAYPGAGVAGLAFLALAPVAYTRLRLNRS
ncbi:MAG: hypothetical protein IRY95_08080, partial [Clostridia bacterium]|nr:hypothetical protein [Clostridia bacterium]